MEEIPRHLGILASLCERGLAGHLARSVLQVEWFMDGPTAGAETVSPVHYYARLKSTALAVSALNVGVRARSEETSAAGPRWTRHERDAEEALRVL